MTNNTNISELITSFLSGNATVEEKQRLNSWLMESEENMELFSEVSTIWEATALNNDFPVNTDLRYNKLKMRIKKTHAPGLFVTILKFAAVILLFVGIGTLGSYFIFSKRPTFLAGNDNNILVASEKEKTRIVLPDGTKVWLNANSSISYNNDAAGSYKPQKIALEGEAFFEVAKQKDMFFEVDVYGFIIKVMGTSFNVKAYPDEDVIEAILVEGKIAVSHKDNPGQELLLLPNEQIRISKNAHDISSVSKGGPGINSEEPDQIDLSGYNVQHFKAIEPSEYVSWKEEKWIIDNEKLGDLVSKLEKRFSVEISFQNNKIRDYRFSGTFVNENLTQVLDAISYAAPVKYEIKGSSVILYPKK